MRKNSFESKLVSHWISASFSIVQPQNDSNSFVVVVFCFVFCLFFVLFFKTFHNFITPVVYDGMLLVGTN